MNRSTSICLVTPGHIASTPRLVKEADALTEAGYSVTVVGGDHYAPVRPLDDQILRTRRWTSVRVPMGGPVKRWVRGATRRLAARAVGRGNASATLAAWAHQPFAFELARTAERTRSILYHGHCVGGLVAAGIAAQRTGAKLGFDAEDFHRVECTETPDSAVVAIEDKWLPQCAHLTAASPMIAAAYASAVGVPTPAVILNVFPLSEAPSARPTPSSQATLYWFSQTIGPDRGLEPLLAALGAGRLKCELHLRGLPAVGYKQHLQESARRAGFAGEIVFEPIAAAAEMARLAAPFTAGLSLEQSSPPNRDVCLTNKIFTYLLAGLPIILTPTAAQRQIAPELGDAALLVDLATPDSAGAALARFVGDADRREKAAAAAWHLGQTRFNWEVEKAILLERIRRLLGSPSPQPLS